MGVYDEGAYNVGKATTTIAVAGFPQDVTLRELQNLCKLCPGFEGAKPNMRQGKPRMLFVKFVSGDAASEAIMMIQNIAFDDAQPELTLKAEFANSEMSSTPARMEDSPHSTAAWGQDRVSPQSAMPAAKRPRTATGTGTQSWPQPPTSGNVDTLAVRIEGHSEGELRSFFAEHEGFVALKFNGRSANCFAQFLTPECAQTALEAAISFGFAAECARQSARTAQPETEMWAARPPMEMWAPPHASLEHSGGFDTIACKVEQFTESEICSFFESLPGFETLKFATNNFFVKFSDQSLAQDALGEARFHGFTGDFAKQPSRRAGDRNAGNQVPAAAWTVPSPRTLAAPSPRALHVPSPRALAQVQQAAASSGPPGVSTLACKVQNFTEEEIWSFFSQLEGFVTLKMNAKKSNFFAKFIAPHAAEDGLVAARRYLSTPRCTAL